MEPVAVLPTAVPTTLVAPVTVPAPVPLPAPVPVSAAAAAEERALVLYKPVNPPLFPGGPPAGSAELPYQFNASFLKAQGKLARMPLQVIFPETQLTVLFDFVKSDPSCELPGFPPVVAFALQT